MIISDLWLSGRVARWHTHPHLSVTGDTLAAHQCRVAQLMVAFWPDTNADALRAALTHDVGEFAVGNTPHPTKSSWPPDIAKMMAFYEESHRVAISGCDIELTDDEIVRLMFCDQLDGLLWATLHGRAQDFTSGFPALRGQLHEIAIEQGVKEKFLDLVEGING